MICAIYIVAALASLTTAQYVQLIENGPTLASTDVNARLAPRRFAAQWCDKDDLYVYGGDTGSAAGRVRDMWKFEGDTRRWLWFPDGPGPVGRSEMAYWNLYGRFWLYGGRSDAGSVLSDLWSYTLVDRVWHASSVAPAGPGPVYVVVFASKNTSNLCFTGTAPFHGRTRSPTACLFTLVAPPLPRTTTTHSLPCGRMTW